MEIYFRRVLICLLIFLDCNIFYGQMIEGNYPFQIIDTLIFQEKASVLQIDTNQKPSNFVSKSEMLCKNRMKLHKNDSILYLKLIDEIHLETNERDFVAGISNHSEDTLLIPIQDCSLISILEAMDEKREWKPIQFWPISGCGNSYYSEVILPKQTLLFTVNNDFGEYRTKMRIRLHGADTILISDEFVGSINKDMFKIKNDIVQDYKHILCDSIFYLDSSRFGDLNNLDFEIIEFEEE